MVRRDRWRPARHPQRAAARRRHPDAHPVLAGRRRGAPGRRPARGRRRGAGRRGGRRSRRARRGPRPLRRRAGPGHSRRIGRARPTGGVGGTRRGVKCLHAHYAWYLAGATTRSASGWPPIWPTLVREPPWECRLGSPPSTAGPTRPACSSPTRRPPARAAHAHHPARAGRRRRPPARARRHRPDARGAARVPGGDGQPRGRPGADDRHVGGAGCGQPRGVLRRRRGCRRGAPGAAQRGRGGPAVLCRRDRFPRRQRRRRRPRRPVLVGDIGGGSTEFAVGPEAPAGRAGSNRSRCGRSTSAASGSPSAGWPAIRRPLRSFASPATRSGCFSTSSPTSSPSPGRRRRSSAWPARSPAWPPWTRASSPTTVTGCTTTCSPGRRSRTSCGELAAVPSARRAEIPGSKRAASMSSSAGRSCWPRSCDHFGFERCLTSEADILDGLVMTLLDGAPTAVTPTA